MQNFSFAKTLRIVAIALFIAVLAACGRNDIKNGTKDAENVPATYDLSIKADKDGQFDFDGATLSPEDLRGHIRYLNETGKPVHAILLVRGEKEKIKNTHVAALASISRDLKITAYVTDNDGKTKVITIVDDK
jgi:hypothetical protein